MARGQRRGRDQRPKHAARRTGRQAREARQSAALAAKTPSAHPGRRDNDHEREDAPA